MLIYLSFMTRVSYHFVKYATVSGVQFPNTLSLDLCPEKKLYMSSDYVHKTIVCTYCILYYSILHLKYSLTKGTVIENTS